MRNTICLQALAAMLITNSHLKGFYPKAWMGADGLFGNSIFFLLSGYGITLSLLGREQKFVPYYLRRIARIYPTLWLAEIIFHYAVKGGWKSDSWSTYLHTLVYPTEYGYVRHIMVYYAVFYVLKPWLVPRNLLKWIAILALPLAGICLYDASQQPMERLTLGETNGWVWWVFFFQVMLLGGYMASSEKKPTAVFPRRGVVILAAGLALYVALKFLMVTGSHVPGVGIAFARLYFMLFLLTPWLLAGTFRMMTSAAWLEGLSRWPLIQASIAFVGGLTLEIYVIHVFVLQDERVRDLPFPSSVAVFFAVTICLAWIANRLVVPIQRSWRTLTPRRS